MCEYFFCFNSCNSCNSWPKKTRRPQAAFLLATNSTNYTNKKRPAICGTYSINIFFIKINYPALLRQGQD
jgi:hypothetical protein